MSQEPYHHGDLPAALLRAARELIAEGGVGAVSVRAVARRAGVSHAAPGHHFGDRAGLLAALAAEGFDLFHDALRAARDRLPDDASAADVLASMGRSYIDFGLAAPEHYVVMFRPEMVDCDDPTLEAAGSRAFAALVATARGCLAPGTDDGVVLTAAMTAWSATHGFVSLAHDVPMMQADYLPVIVPMADQALATLVAGLRAHPDWVGDDVPASAIADDLSDPVVDGLRQASAA